MTKKKQTIIGIGGVATVGKDTFFQLLKLSRPDLIITRYAFADNLKAELEHLIAEHFDLDIWNLSPEDKAVIRPLLVWWGCTKRHFNKNYWINSVSKIMSCDTTSDIQVVTDVRFENEAQWILGNGGKIIHIQRVLADGYIVPPVNKEEATNDPLVKVLSTKNLIWPTVLPDKKIGELLPFVEKALEGIL